MACTGRTAALLEAHSVALATNPEPRDADANAQKDLPPVALVSIAPECKPTLIDLMAQAIVALWLSAQEADHDEH